MLAALTGTSITDAIANAVRSQLAIERVKSDAGLATRRAESERILLELRRLPITGPDVSDHDLYDRDGLPK
jgi:hypothetical protein